MHVPAPATPSCSRKLLITVLIFSRTLPRDVSKKMQIIFNSAAFLQVSDSIVTLYQGKGVKELVFFQEKKTILLSCKCKLFFKIKDLTF